MTTLSGRAVYNEGESDHDAHSAFAEIDKGNQ